MSGDTGSRDTRSPLISVVLPTYNRASMLAVAVQSVLAQTFADLELIVVDDGSTDETPGVLEAIADPRLVRLRSDQQRGAAVSRNAGIGAARGEFLAFQDSDDEWLPGKLERQLSVFADHGSGLGAVGGGATPRSRSRL
jgi:glycosyltransferase involved in cell wall biosynthesis